jgi:hypothetical protein
MTLAYRKESKVLMKLRDVTIQTHKITQKLMSAANN